MNYYDYNRNDFQLEMGRNRAQRNDDSRMRQTKAPESADDGGGQEQEEADGREQEL